MKDTGPLPLIKNEIANLLTTAAVNVLEIVFVRSGFFVDVKTADEADKVAATLRAAGCGGVLLAFNTDANAFTICSDYPSK